MVFLTKVKNDQKSADLIMPSKMNENYNQIRTTDLSALLFKDSSKTPSQLERDAGFCSGGSEIGDDYQSDRIQSSPSSADASEDSIDIKLGSIILPHKRKAFDAIKCENDIPLKKRFKYESVYGTVKNSLNSDASFRPWIPEQNEQHLPNEAEVLIRHPGVTTLHRMPSDVTDNTDINNSNVCQDEQPLALVTKKSKNENNKIANIDFGKKKLPINVDEENKETRNNELESNAVRQTPQRNYKNMTRERRIEANARERTRVHTISAAFDTLRQAIPSYSNTQKLSKLSILRVACAYILTLSRMTGADYSADQSEPSVQSCLEEIAKNIQTEGKARKRKDE